MDALYHARSSARKWGGIEADYLPIHEWFDETAGHVNDFRHRAIRHHALGIADCVRIFGRMLTLSTGKEVPVKKIAERHVNEDIGFIPTVSDWVRTIQAAPWMKKPQRVKVTF